MRLGFGDKVDETEKGGLAKFENGHIEVSSSAHKFAIESHDSVPPRVALGMALIEGAGWGVEATHPAVAELEESRGDDD